MVYVCIKEVKNWALIYSGEEAFKIRIVYFYFLKSSISLYVLLLFTDFSIWFSPSPSSPIIIVQYMLIKAQFWLQDCFKPSLMASILYT